jgi:protein-tyrosine phosphatase
VTFQVLFVCTGNVCRSPVAERLFLARMNSGCDLTASSAGIRALAGLGIDPPSASALIALGGDPTGHRARWFTPELAESADLVLTAQTSHRVEVLRATPSAMRRTFALHEFVRLAASLPAADATEDEAADVTAVDPRVRVARIAAQRGMVPPVGPGEDDVADPFGRGIDIARICAAEVSAAVDAVLAALGAS